MSIETTFAPVACFLLLVFAAAPCRSDDATGEKGDSVSVEGPAWDGQKGVWRYQVAGPFQKGPNAVEVLLPDDYDKSRRYRVLYVLPVEPGIGGRYGDGLRELKKIDAHNRHDLICVAPAFDAVPWFMDHATDPARRHESHLVQVVVPLIDARYSTAAAPEGRLLLGFSKSGWGAFTLLLRNPRLFGYAASWDAPLMQKEEDWNSFGIAQAAGTVENFRRYQPARLFASQAEHFQGDARFTLLGHKGFGGGGGAAYKGEHTHTRWAHDTMQSLGIRHVYDNRLIVDHRWGSGWVKPAVEALISIAEKGEKSN